jgi:hypothetical protein
LRFLEGRKRTVSASGGGEGILVGSLGVELGMERDMFLCGSGLKSGVHEAENRLVTLFRVNLKVIIVTK